MAVGSRAEKTIISPRGCRSAALTAPFDRDKIRVNRCFQGAGQVAVFGLVWPFGRLCVVALAIGGTASVEAAPAGLSVAYEDAMRNVKAFLEPVCGKGRKSRCLVSRNARPKSCPLEYLVTIPEESREGSEPAGFWIGLDARGRVVAAEAGGKVLCPSA